MSNTDMISRDYASEITSGSMGVWSSFPAETLEDKKRLYSATSDSKKISDILDQYINLKDIIVETVDMANEETGIVEPQPRVILLTDKGEAYAAISSVIMSDVKKILAYFGMPNTWEKPLKVKVSEGRSNKGRHFFHISF